MGFENYNPKLIMQLSEILIYFTTGFSLCLREKHIDDTGDWIWGVLI